jgi:hypothetical protein
LIIALADESLDDIDRNRLQPPGIHPYVELSAMELLILKVSVTVK